MVNFYYSFFIILIFLTFAVNAKPINYYSCLKIDSKVKIDGKLDEPAWQAAEWTENFIDIEGSTKPKPGFETKIKMLWDNEYLYIAANLEEPHIWATLTKHDTVIFYDNDFEVFIDPDGDGRFYVELEINAGVDSIQFPLYTGLYLPTMNAEELKNAIQTAMEHGAKGISVFDYNAMKGEHWIVFKAFLNP